jgi:hypothetical protein
MDDRDYEAMNKHNYGNDFIADVSNFATYSITPQLRYKKKSIDLGNGLAKEEYRLQQRWQGSDGSEYWQWIDYVE